MITQNEKFSFRSTSSLLSPLFFSGGPIEVDIDRIPNSTYPTSRSDRSPTESIFDVNLPIKSFLSQ